MTEASHSRGWRPYPGATRRQVDTSPIEPARVTGVGAICDLRSECTGDARSQSFCVGEFVRLEDERRIVLHEDRGFTIGLGSSAESGIDAIRAHESAESITRNVLNVVRPDDDRCPDDHPWTWLAALARGRGLDVTADDLRSLRYQVVLSERLKRWLTPS